MDKFKWHFFVGHMICLIPDGYRLYIFPVSWMAQIHESIHFQQIKMPSVFTSIGRHVPQRFLENQNCFDVLGDAGFQYLGFIVTFQ